MKASFCDECANFDRAAPVYELDWEGTVCKLKHEPKWFSPKSNPHDTDWGWKRVCTDFERKGQLK